MRNIDWLSPTQIKSLVDGGSMFFEIIEEDMEELLNKEFDEIIDSKLEIGDEFYVQEEFYEDEEYLMYKNDINDFEPYTWFSKEDMQPHQSRVKGKIKNCELARIKDAVIQDNDYFKNEDILFFNKICQEKNLNITYEDNPYIILYEIIL